MNLQSLPSAARPFAPELHLNVHGFSIDAAVRWRADQSPLKTDRKDFVRRLGLVAEETQTVIYAWALMSNHAHMLACSGSVGLRQIHEAALNRVRGEL